MSRQGISGNPQRRAEQLAQRRPVIADEPDLPPLVLDFRSGKPEDFPLRDLAYALAGGAEPRPWWGESHQRILAAARPLPGRPVSSTWRRKPAGSWATSSTSGSTRG